MNFIKGIFLISAVGTVFSGTAFAGTYSVELRFNFSPPTDAVRSYKGDILGHVAVFEKLKANTEDEAYAEAQKLIRTKYNKPVQVSVCYSEVNEEPEHNCTKTVTDAFIVGVDVLNGNNFLCKIGDSRTSGMQPCKRSGPANQKGAPKKQESAR